MVALPGYQSSQPDGALHLRRSPRTDVLWLSFLHLVRSSVVALLFRRIHVDASSGAASGLVVPRHHYPRTPLFEIEFLDLSRTFSHIHHHPRPLKDHTVIGYITEAITTRVLDHTDTAVIGHVSSVVFVPGRTVLTRTHLVGIPSIHPYTTTPIDHRMVARIDGPRVQAMSAPGYEDQIIFIEEETPRGPVRRRVRSGDVEIRTVEPPTSRAPTRSLPVVLAPARQPERGGWWKNRPGRPYLSDKMRLEIDVGLRRKKPKRQVGVLQVTNVDVDEHYRQQSHGSIPVPPPAPEPPATHRYYYEHNRHYHGDSVPPQYSELPENHQRSWSPESANVIEVGPPASHRRSHRAVTSDEDYFETEVEVAPRGRRLARMEDDRREREYVRTVAARPPQSVVVHQERAMVGHDGTSRSLRQYRYPREATESPAQEMIRVIHDDERHRRRRTQRRVHFEDESE